MPLTATRDDETRTAAAVATARSALALPVAKAPHATSGAAPAECTCRRATNVGCVPLMFHLMWGMRLNRRSAPFRVPPTVVFSRERPTEWFFTSRSSGAFLKKRSENVTPQAVFDHFSVGALNGSSGDLAPNRIVAVWVFAAAAVTPTAGLRFGRDGDGGEGPAGHVVHLTANALAELLFVTNSDFTAPRCFGILQRFVEPAAPPPRTAATAGDADNGAASWRVAASAAPLGADVGVRRARITNTQTRVVWSERFATTQRRRARLPLYDDAGDAAASARGATFGGAASESAPVRVPAYLSKRVTAAMRAAVAFVNASAAARSAEAQASMRRRPTASAAPYPYHVAYADGFFKEAGDGGRAPWLLWFRAAHHLGVLPAAAAPASAVPISRAELAATGVAAGTDPQEVDAGEGGEVATSVARFWGCMGCWQPVRSPLPLLLQPLPPMLTAGGDAAGALKEEGVRPVAAANAAALLLSLERPLLAAAQLSSPRGRDRDASASEEQRWWPLPDVGAFRPPYAPSHAFAAPEDYRVALADLDAATAAAEGGSDAPDDDASDGGGADCGVGRPLREDNEGVKRLDTWRNAVLRRQYRHALLTRLHIERAAASAAATPVDAAFVLSNLARIAAEECQASDALHPVQPVADARVPGAAPAASTAGGGPYALLEAATGRFVTDSLRRVAHEALGRNAQLASALKARRTAAARTKDWRSRAARRRHERVAAVAAAAYDAHMRGADPRDVLVTAGNCSGVTDAIALSRPCVRPATADAATGPADWSAMLRGGDWREGRADAEPCAGGASERGGGAAGGGRRYQTALRSAAAREERRRWEAAVAWHVQRSSGVPGDSDDDGAGGVGAAARNAWASDLRAGAAAEPPEGGRGGWDATTRPVGDREAAAASNQRVRDEKLWWGGKRALSAETRRLRLSAGRRRVRLMRAHTRELLDASPSARQQRRADGTRGAFDDSAAFGGAVADALADDDDGAGDFDRRLIEALAAEQRATRRRPQRPATAGPAAAGRRGRCALAISKRPAGIPPLAGAGRGGRLDETAAVGRRRHSKAPRGDGNGRPASASLTLRTAIGTGGGDGSDGTTWRMSAPRQSAASSLSVRRQTPARMRSAQSPPPPAGTLSLSASLDVGAMEQELLQLQGGMRIDEDVDNVDDGDSCGESAGPLMSGSDVGSAASAEAASPKKTSRARKDTVAAAGRLSTAEASPSTKKHGGSNAGGGTGHSVAPRRTRQPATASPAVVANADAPPQAATATKKKAKKKAASPAPRTRAQREAERAAADAQALKVREAKAAERAAARKAADDAENRAIEAADAERRAALEEEAAAAAAPRATLDDSGAFDASFGDGGASAPPAAASRSSVAAEPPTLAEAASAAEAAAADALARVAAHREARRVEEEADRKRRAADAAEAAERVAAAEAAAKKQAEEDAAAAQRQAEDDAREAAAARKRAVEDAAAAEAARKQSEEEAAAAARKAIADAEAARTREEAAEKRRRELEARAKAKEAEAAKEREERAMAAALKQAERDYEAEIDRLAGGGGEERPASAGALPRHSSPVARGGAIGAYDDDGYSDDFAADGSSNASESISFEDSDEDSGGAPAKKAKKHKHHKHHKRKSHKHRKTVGGSSSSSSSKRSPLDKKAATDAYVAALKAKYAGGGASAGASRRSTAARHTQDS